MEKTELSSLVEKITTHIRNKFDAAGVLYVFEFIKMNKASDLLSLSEYVINGIQELRSKRIEVPSKIYGTVTHYNQLTEKNFDRKSVSNSKERFLAIKFNEDLIWKISVLNEVLSLVKPEILQLEINQENKDSILNDYKEKYLEEITSDRKLKYSDAFFNCYEYHYYKGNSSQDAFEITMTLLRPNDKNLNQNSFSKRLEIWREKNRNKKKSGANQK